jgi:hypothetical protein
MISGENDEFVLSGEGRKHHVHLRKDAALLPEFVVDSSIEPRRFRVQRPQSHMMEELIQSTAVLVRLSGLLNADF